MNTKLGNYRRASSARALNPEEIERQIDMTREELERTLDALQAKLSFRRRLSGTLHSARERVGPIADAVVRTVRRYPAPALLVGLPMLWLIATRVRTRRF